MISNLMKDQEQFPAFSHQSIISPCMLITPFDMIWDNWCNHSGYQNESVIISKYIAIINLKANIRISYYSNNLDIQIILTWKWSSRRHADEKGLADNHSSYKYLHAIHEFWIVRKVSWYILPAIPTMFSFWHISEMKKQLYSISQFDWFCL